MRLTENIRIASMSAAEARAAENLYNATRQASTGLKVAAPSDDPSAYAQATGHQNLIDRLTTRSDVLSHAASNLDIAEGALAQAGDIISHARELAVQMANGDITPQARADTANEIQQLIDTMVGLANTKGSDRYLFGGTATGTPPFTATGAFTGNDNAVDVELSDAVTLRANASGAQTFTAAGGRDVFQDLASFAQALSTNNVSGIQSAIDNLDAAHTQIVAARSEIGITTNRLRGAVEINTSTVTTIQAEKARVTEADPIEAFTRLSEAKSSYERSIQVTAQILSIVGQAR